MPEPRARRELVPVEVAAVLAIAAIPLGGVPVALPLLLVATLARYLRGRSWGEVARGRLERALVGLGAGALALALALVVGTPFLESFGTGAIQWSQLPVVRGSGSHALVAILMVAVTALAMELAMRGWIVERVLELSPGAAGLPILVGALAEAIVTPGEIVARLGAALFGAGLGAMYVASGRSVVAPVLARVTFQAGAVALEALMVIG